MRFFASTRWARFKNRSLARSISDAGWSELVRQLEYKSDWYGRELIKIDRFFPSSKRCGNCGFVIDKLPLSVREWECSQCSSTHDRDINAAKNILAAGLAVSVCGANVRPDRQGSCMAVAKFPRHHRWRGKETETHPPLPPPRRGTLGVGWESPPPAPAQPRLSRRQQGWGGCQEL